MILSETQYFPSIGWCQAVWQSSTIVLDAAEHYQKGGFRNRCHIAGPNGQQRLSIPLLKGKHQQTPVREVRISSDVSWQRQHWRSIQTAYGNAPYFEHYAAEIYNMLHKPWTFLFDLNLEIMERLLRGKLKWEGAIQLQETYISPEQWKYGPDIRDQTPAFKGAYAQVFQEKHGFLADVSVLDLLFCCGKNGAEYLSAIP